MPRNKDPAVLFYTSDFLADTTLWKYDELGRYIKLLCIQHLQDGISEDDFTAVAEGCKRVIDKFVKGEDGKYRNHRMEEEIDDRARFLKKQQLNGSKGGRPKNPNETQTKPKRNPNESPRVEDENENINENNNIKVNLTAVTNKEGAHARNEVPQRVKKAPQTSRKVIGVVEVDYSELIEMRFTQFWEKYPKKVAKVDARKAFTRLNPDADLLGVMLAALERQKVSEGWTKEGGRYIPYPATWLNQRRWEDEDGTPPEKKPEKPPDAETPKYSSFDAEAAFAEALARSYGGTE